MSTLNFTITATQAEFDNFADRLGYMSNIINESNELIANPETRPKYLQRLLKEKVANIFYVPYIVEIDSQINNTRETDKENTRESVRSRVGVNFVA